jgi:N-acetylneuraminic acid mutarotase
MKRHNVGVAEVVEITTEDFGLQLNLAESAAESNGKVTLITGGVDEHASLSSLCALITSEHKVQKLRPLPDARARHALAAGPNGDFLIVGGVSIAKDGALRLANEILHYDINADRWSDYGHLPLGAELLVAETINGKLYAIAGDTGTSTQPGRPIVPAKCRNDVQILELSNGKWTTGAPKPTPETGVTSAVMDGRIYVVSSTDDQGVVNALVEVYDVDSNSWERLPNMPTPRTSVPCGFVERKLYCVGGLGNDLKASHAVEVYDPSSKKWEVLTSTFPSRVGAAHAVHHGALMIIGGWSR